MNVGFFIEKLQRAVVMVNNPMDVTFRDVAMLQEAAENIIVSLRSHAADVARLRAGIAELEQEMREIHDRPLVWGITGGPLTWANRLAALREGC
tara:strand:- start:8402 stop:8683 length:282 start_codon:yes stop_codon:yes gene_type:complete